MIGKYIFIWFSIIDMEFPTFVFQQGIIFICITVCVSDFRTITNQIDATVIPVDVFTANFITT